MPITRPIRRDKPSPHSIIEKKFLTERWITFPAQLGDHRVFITFDDSFSAVADSDSRCVSLEVRATIQAPDEAGLPNEKEFAALRAVDIALEAALIKEGAVYVGRVTVAGYRHFFFM